MSAAPGARQQQQSHRSLVGLILPSGSSISNPGQNLVVNDPPSELSSICRPAHQGAGDETPVMTLDPYEASQYIGQKVPDMGLDIFSHAGEVKKEDDNDDIYFCRTARQQVVNLLIACQQLPQDGSLSLSEQLEIVQRKLLTNVD